MVVVVVEIVTCVVAEVVGDGNAVYHGHFHRKTVSTTEGTPLVTREDALGSLAVSGWHPYPPLSEPAYQSLQRAAAKLPKRGLKKHSSISMYVYMYVCMYVCVYFNR